MYQKKENWRTGWVKGHWGIEGNEMVVRLANAAAVEDGTVIYDRISTEAIMTRVRENGLHLWQQNWTNTGKGAVTKAFFPAVTHRLRQKIPVTP